MTDPCNVNEIVRQLTAIEDIKQICEELGECPLTTKLGTLIDEHTTECKRLAGECGNIDIGTILDDNDFFNSVEALEASLPSDSTEDISRE